MDRKTILFRGKRCYIERERGREGEREASGRQEEWTKDEEVRREGGRTMITAARAAAQQVEMLS